MVSPSIKLQRSGNFSSIQPHNTDVDWMSASPSSISFLAIFNGELISWMVWLSTYTCYMK